MTPGARSSATSFWTIRRPFCGSRSQIFPDGRREPFASSLVPTMSGLRSWDRSSGRATAPVWHSPRSSRCIATPAVRRRSDPHTWWQRQVQQRTASRSERHSVRGYSPEVIQLRPGRLSVTVFCTCTAPTSRTKHAASRLCIPVPASEMLSERSGCTTARTRRGLLTDDQCSSSLPPVNGKLRFQASSSG